MGLGKTLQVRVRACPVSTCLPFLRHQTTVCLHLVNGSVVGVVGVVVGVVGVGVVVGGGGATKEEHSRLCLKQACDSRTGKEKEETTCSWPVSCPSCDSPKRIEWMRESPAHAVALGHVRTWASSKLETPGTCPQDKIK